VKFIILDSTWQQARGMIKKIPSHIPRVQLNPVTLSTFKARRQLVDTRLCTAECTIQFLRHYLDIDDTVYKTLKRGFKIKERVGLLQKGNRTKDR
jgi:DTW domain-containing protein YfiP